MRRATRLLGMSCLLVACRGTGTTAPAPSASVAPESAPSTTTTPLASASTSSAAKTEDWVIRVKRYTLADGFGRTYWFYPSGKVESETLIEGRDSTTVPAAAVTTLVDGLAKCGLCAPGKTPASAAAGKTKRFLVVEVKGGDAGSTCSAELPWESWQVAEKACLPPLQAGMKTVGEDLDSP